MSGRSSILCRIKAAQVVRDAAGDDALHVTFTGAGRDLLDAMPVTDDGAARLNNFIDALGADRATFWADGIVVDNAKPPNILAIGSRKVPGARVRILTSDGRTVAGYGPRASAR